MLIAVIIGLVLVSVFGTWTLLKFKRNRINDTLSNISRMSHQQDELFGRIQTVVGRQRHEEASPQSGIIEHTQKLNEEARQLLLVAETDPTLRKDSSFISLRESWTVVEENLSSAFRTHRAHVADFNSTLELVPASLVAKMLKYQREAELN